MSWDGGVHFRVSWSSNWTMLEFRGHCMGVRIRLRFICVDQTLSRGGVGLLRRFCPRRRPCASAARAAGPSRRAASRAGPAPGPCPRLLFRSSPSRAAKASVFFGSGVRLDTGRRRFFAVFGGPEMRGAAGPSAARRILVHCERVPQKDGLSASRDRRRAGSFVVALWPC